MSILKKILKFVGALFALLVVLLGAYAGYAVATHEGRFRFPDTPMPKVTVSTDPEIIERGRYLTHGPAHCAQCHGGDDRDHPELLTATTPLSGGLPFILGPIGSTYSPNLTPDPETGIGAFTDEQLARTLRTGVRPNGDISIFMRLSAATLSDEDIGAVVSYLRSQEPVRKPVPTGEWKVLGKMMVPMMGLAPRSGDAPVGVQPSPEGPTVERGAYLVESVMLCTACHSEMDPITAEIVGPRGGGSLPEPSHGDDSDMEYVAPNLTSHATGVTGKLDEDAFVARIHHGRLHASSIMPWENFHLTSDDDLRSVYRHLKSLPPVENDVGPTYRKAGWVAEE